MTQPHIGERIKERRTARGLTQVQLADKANISQSYLSGLEAGTKKSPAYDVVEAIATVLECSPRELSGEINRESLAWFWRTRFAEMSDGEILRLRRLSIEERAQWVVKTASEMLNPDEIGLRTGLTSGQIQEIGAGRTEIMPPEADQLVKLDLPPRFLVDGYPPPREEDLQLLLTSPDAHEWLRFFRRCHEANVFPHVMEHSLNAALAAKQTR